MFDLQRELTVHTFYFCIHKNKNVQQQTLINAIYFHNSAVCEKIQI